MDEARRVLDRLERIERLRDDGAPAAVLLGEVRALLSEGERWLATERPEGLDAAKAALTRCRVELRDDGRDGSCASGSCAAQREEVRSGALL
jgi:hypothetical protein